jgi:hypothetical protein
MRNDSRFSAVLTSVAFFQIPHSYELRFNSPNELFDFQENESGCQEAQILGQIVSLALIVETILSWVVCTVQTKFSVREEEHRMQARK